MHDKKNEKLHVHSPIGALFASRDIYAFVSNKILLVEVLLFESPHVRLSVGLVWLLFRHTCQKPAHINFVHLSSTQCLKIVALF